MSYVDAIHNKETDEIHIVERINGERVYNVLPAKYAFYYEDQRGRHKTMWGTPVSKVVANNYKQLQKELRANSGRKLYETDLNPIFRCLEENYMGVEAPKLNLGFFDIEVDFDPKRGFARPEDPFARITAISVHLSHLDKLVTFVLKPDLPVGHADHLSWEAAEAICKNFDDCFLCNDEEELLNFFLEIIEDCDVLSGWNSTGFDIPYVVNRIERILGKEYSKKLCLWGKRPRKRKYVRFNKEHETYELSGRVHLDYLDLYKKHNPQELHSYKLDFVGEIEVGENKTPYEGSLDQLYKRDFEKFIEYNRQDTLLLVKIDKKRKFIELANQIAHTNTVLIQTTMGSVALIEQAIINESHRRGMQVPNRKADAYVHESDDGDEENIETGPAVGAYVAVPKKGLHDQIGAVDINSLYPSTLRALNMGPETLIGQIRPARTEELIAQRIRDGWQRADAWHGIFCLLEFDAVHDKTDEVLTVDFEDGTVMQVTAAELYDFIFEQGNPYCLSANGTIFRTDTEAVIPGLLARWYSERKEMQGKAKKYAALAFGQKISDDAMAAVKEAGLGTADRGVCTTEYDFKRLGKLAEDNDIPGIVEFVREHDLRIVKSAVRIWDDAVCKEYADQYVFWDQRQQARKILLNSLYGALLNEGCRFYDHRIGQSVTLTGRSIAKHMNSKVNELITGVYQVDGEAIIYADTDSSYFSAAKVLASSAETAHLLNDRDAIIQLYDQIGDDVNDSFPGFMNSRFHTGLERGAIIAAGRELVASRGLFITKKRYAVLNYDKEGTRLDVNGSPGKVKAMGLDLKRADTPKMMQQFLEKILINLLSGGEREDIIREIKEFRAKFRELDGWLKGTPKKANGVAGYQNRINDNLTRNFLDVKKQKVKGGMIPGHVQAAINWNTLRQMHGDNYSAEIQDGAKVVVCFLKPNPLKMTSVAYPFDEGRLPDWFKELPFDHELMEDKIIDQKVSNLIGVLEWDLRDTREDTTFNDLFSF
jgi:DNA polymerase elongation subunit (family B)